MTAFKLPLPPSSNDLVRPALLSPVWCSGCGRAVHGRADIRLVATGEAKTFRRRAHSRLPTAPIAGPVEIYVTVYVDNIASDGRNRDKALDDALNGNLFFDDKQIAEWHGRKVITNDPSQVGVVVEVRPADPLEHPELARRLAKSIVQKLDNAARQPSLGFELPGVKTRPAKPPRPAPGPRTPLPEPLAQRLNRLVKPALIQNRPDDDPEAT